MRIQRNAEAGDRRKGMAALLGRWHISRGRAWWLFAGCLLFFSFLKLPATGMMDTIPQSWEAVPAYAAAHHLQWGKDVVFTYGPLAFLSLDYYWGFNFVPIFIWSLIFPVVLTAVLLRFLSRVAWPVRMGFCLVLPWLTIPRSVDLGIDPIYLFAIVLYGIACLPTERPGVARLVILGSMLGLFGLFKFTFFIFGGLTLVTVALAYFFRRQFRQAVLMTGSAVIAFLAAWLLAGQGLAHIGPWMRHSWEIAAGYAPAMALPPATGTLCLGLGVCAGWVALVFLYLRDAASPVVEIPKVVLLAAGLFLAWKEGFVQADPFHVTVFFVFSILATVTMLTFFAPRGKRPFSLVIVSLITLGLAVAPFLEKESRFLPAMRAGAVRRLADTFTALFAPVHYKHQLEADVAARREAVLLPGIAALAGDAPMGVLGYEQDVAVLNGFNYAPHPVFQNYSAYTPELQRLNADFFASERAPKFLLWRYSTVGNRFPTLDDGEIILSVLNSYVPVRLENEFVLWKRKDAAGGAYRFVPYTNGTVKLDEWIPIPPQATWLKIELQRTWLDDSRGFLFQPSMPAIEVRLEEGTTKTFYLLPGNARFGFVVNPLLETAPDLVLPVLKKGFPARVVAARVFSRKGEFEDPVRFSAEIIQGVEALDAKP